MKDSIIPQIKEALQEPTPDPKFKLWQHTRRGQIVGFYWRDVDGAWQESTLPGWWYAIRCANGYSFHHESGIEVVD